MAKDEIKRSQRQQVHKQIGEHLDPGKLVDFSDKKSTRARFYGEDLPNVVPYHTSSLLWRGYWFVKEQDNDYIPSPNSIDEFFEVSVDDPTGSKSSFITQDAIDGKFFYEFVPDAGDGADAFQYTNVGVSTTFIAAVSGTISFRVEAAPGDAFVITQDTIPVADGYAANGGSISVGLSIRANTKTTVGIYFYSKRSIPEGSSEPARFVRVITPLSYYALSSEDLVPDPPQNPTATALESGNLIKWDIAQDTAPYVKNTQIFAHREDEPEDEFRIVGSVEEVGQEFLHDREVYEHFHNGTLFHTPEEILIQETPYAYTTIFDDENGFVIEAILNNLENGVYAEAVDDGEFLWKFGSDLNYPSGEPSGVGLYHINNKEVNNGVFTNLDTFPDFGFIAQESALPLTMPEMLSNVPSCPDAEAFWCVTLHPSAITPNEFDNRHFALATDHIALNGYYDYSFTMKSLQRYVAKFNHTDGLSEFIDEDDEYAFQAPEVFFKVIAQAGRVLYESDEWTSLGSLTVSLGGGLDDPAWGHTLLNIAAADMTASVVDQITDGEEPVVSAIRFKIDVLDPSRDYDPSTGDMYYRMWLLGSMHMFPVQGVNIEAGITYTYKLKHTTSGHVVSAFSDEVSAMAVMPTSPALAIDIDIATNARWNNETPLVLSLDSLSPLEITPTLYMRLNDTVNIYGSPYAQDVPGTWKEIPESAIIVGGGDDPDHYTTTWEIDKQVMFDLGFWPNWDLQYPGSGLPPLAVDDPYPHFLTYANEYQFRVEAYPLGNETDPVEAHTTAVYDPEPPAYNIEIIDVFTRTSSKAGEYKIDQVGLPVEPPGQENGVLKDSPSPDAVQYLIKFALSQYNNDEDIPFLGEDPHWRIEGTSFRYAMLFDNGVPLYRPIGLLNDEWDPETEMIYPYWLGLEPMTVKQFYALYVTDFWGTLVTNYSKEYVESLVLTSNYDKWQELNKDSVYEDNFIVSPHVTVIGLSLVTDCRNALDEVFEHVDLGLFEMSLSSTIESRGYKGTIDLDSYTGYTLLDNIYDPYNPLPSPVGGGWANKWSTYLEARISSVNPVISDYVGAWQDDTLTVIGHGLNGVSGSPSACVTYKTKNLDREYIGDPVLSGQLYNHPNGGPNAPPLKGLAVTPSERAFFGGPLATLADQSDPHGERTLVAYFDPGETTYTSWCTQENIAGSINSMEVQNNRVYCLGDIHNDGVVGGDIGAYDSKSVGIRLDNEGGFDVGLGYFRIFLSGNIFPGTEHVHCSININGTIYIGGGGIVLGREVGWVGRVYDQGNGTAIVSIVHTIDQFFSDDGGGIIRSICGLPNGRIAVAAKGSIYESFYPDGNLQLFLAPFSDDEGVTSIPFKKGINTGIIHSITPSISRKVYIAGDFDSHPEHPGRVYEGVTRVTYATSENGGFIIPSAEQLPDAPNLQPGDALTTCRSYYDPSGYTAVTFAGQKRAFDTYSPTTNTWLTEPTSPLASFSLSDMYQFHYYATSSLGLTFPPNFRDVYSELSALTGPSIPFNDNIGPRGVMFIGEIPDGSIYEDEEEYPLLNDAFISSRTIAAVGIEDDSLDGMIYRLSDNSGKFLQNLKDYEYGPQYGPEHKLGLADRGYDDALQISRYVVRNFTPNSVMDADYFITTYLDNAAISPVSYGDYGSEPWYTYKYPPTSLIGEDGQSLVPIYNKNVVSKQSIFPKIEPVSNCFAFKLNRPPGLTFDQWEGLTPIAGKPVTMICFPQADSTGCNYAVADGEDDFLNIGYSNFTPDRVAFIGAPPVEKPVTPTTDDLSVSARKDTEAKSTAGYIDPMDPVHVSAFSTIPGFIPTFSLKHLTETASGQEEIFENSTVVYSTLYDKGGTINNSLDSTSGSYSFGPRVSTSVDGLKIGNHGIIATDVGETYLFSEIGARSYPFDDFQNVEDPATGKDAHPNRWWGGIGYEFGGITILSSKTTVLQGSQDYHIFSSMVRVSDGRRLIILESLTEEYGRLVPQGIRGVIDIPGSFPTTYYDVLSDIDGEGFIVVTSCGPTPFSYENNAYTDSETDGWSFWFFKCSVDSNGVITQDSSHKLTYNLDDSAERESLSVYGFREPTIRWAGVTSDNTPVIALSFAIDYGYHSQVLASSYIKESRIALMAVVCNWGLSELNYIESLTPIDGTENLAHPFRIVSPGSKPFSASITQKQGYGRHFSPAIWTNTVFDIHNLNQINISKSSSVVHICYIDNVTDLDDDYMAIYEDDTIQSHKWNSNRSRQIDAYGTVVRCVRRFVPNIDVESDADKLKLFAPVGQQYKPMDLSAGQFSVDQDNWGNVVFAYTTRPNADKIDQFNYNKVFPRYRILKIDKVSNHFTDADILTPLSSSSKF